MFKSSQTQRSWSANINLLCVWTTVWARVCELCGAGGAFCKTGTLAFSLARRYCFIPSALIADFLPRFFFWANLTAGEFVQSVFFLFFLPQIAIRCVPNNNMHQLKACEVCWCVCGSLSWSKLTGDCSRGDLQFGIPAICFCRREHTHLWWICAAWDKSLFVCLCLRFLTDFACTHATSKFQ